MPLFSPVTDQAFPSLSLAPPFLVAAAPHKQEDIMTALQQLEQKGRQEGMKQGMHTKSLEIAKNMLSKLNLDVETVAQATGLSREELMKLQKNMNQ